MYVYGAMLYNYLLIFMPGEFPVTGLSVLCENVVRAMTYGLLLCLVCMYFINCARETEYSPSATVPRYLQHLFVLAFVQDTISIDR